MLGFGDAQVAGFFLVVIGLIGWRLVHMIRVLAFLCLLFSSHIKLMRILISNGIILLSLLRVITILKDFSTGYHSRNGFGDSIRTDGDLPILEVGRIKTDSNVTASTRLGVIMDGTIYDRHPRNHETLLEDLWSRRPPQILIGSGLMILASLFTIGQMLVDFSSWPTTLVQVANIDGIDINAANTMLSMMAGFNVLLVGAAGNL